MLDEFGLISRYFTWPSERVETRLSVGDDAALIRPASGSEIVVSTDSLVSGRHFREDASAADIGWKALAVNLSDIAAMGAEPVAFTLALSLPDAATEWLTEFSQGLRSAAQSYGVDLVGGDTTRGPLCITITVFGQLTAGMAVRRSGACVGDKIWLSGYLGDAALALRMGEGAAEALQQRLHRPQPRLGLYQHGRDSWHAAIDVSDGFAADLSHVLAASGLGATVSVADLPVSDAFSRADMPADVKQECMLHGGDDYELIVCTAPDVDLQAIGSTALWTSVGIIESEPGMRLRQQDGTVAALTARGWNHFV